MEPAPLACKVIASQGAGHSNSKRHREPRNYTKQLPVMPNMWEKWFRTTGFWSNRELVVDPAPSACKVRISQGSGHRNSKRHREPRNYPQQPPVMPNRWGKWFRQISFWSSRELVVDPAPLACKVRIHQGARHSNSKRHRQPRNYPQQPPVMPNRWGKWCRTTCF